MLNLKLSYRFADVKDAKKQLDNPLFDLFDALHQTGSIAQTASRLGMSYRHVWGALKTWEETLGSQLIVWERGKRARLTGFGQKLLFAE